MLRNVPRIEKHRDQDTIGRGAGFHASRILLYICRIIPEIDAASKKNADEAVAEAEAEIRNVFPDMGGQLTTMVIQGSPKQAIVEEAETWGADLIIMGSHGYGFWQRALLGSVSSSVVHHAPCSVLVVRLRKEVNDKKS